ncbi:hypothetical protein [Pelomonas sp. Root1444]|uniref:hypothetical protein n=1 Tax=Pelomonas sp. Root1444 TaxID=1736464 RepID=UPI000B2479D4|nr:hypothetical protein [Pelomonas sp. Root1444]
MIANCISSKPFGIVTATWLLALGCGAACAGRLDPPPYDMINRHGVSAMSGRPSPTLVDVTIGSKALGLEHSISTYAGNMVNTGWAGDEYVSGLQGPKDKFTGVLRLTLRHIPPGQANNPAAWVYVMRAYDTGGSFDFSINADGTFTSYNGDPRNILEVVPANGTTEPTMVWTKPDGSTSTFASFAGFDARNLSNLGIPLTIKNIQAANGFTIYYYGGEIAQSVTTNTGYQLKYIYSTQNTAVPNDDPSNNSIPGVGWGEQAPRYVVAINNAIDYCIPTGLNPYPDVNSACPGLTVNWPRATYTWPSGMPRSMFLAPGSLIVTDSEGGTTEYKHAPFKKPASMGDPNFRATRLIGIKSTRANVPEVTYAYDTELVVAGNTDLYAWYTSKGTATLKTSTAGSAQMTYYPAVAGQYPGESRSGCGGRCVTSVDSHVEFGAWLIQSWDQVIRLSKDRRNLLQSITDTLTGVSTVYGYDARLNINSITKNGVTVQTASYPATCTNRKTCNQAIWIRDGNGNQTDFEYEPNSGQVSRVRKPAVISGGVSVRPEIRYTYTPLYAYFKTSATGYAQASAPVYLLTRERTCLATATIADGSGCTGGAADEIITDYDYGPANAANNLELRGVTVSAYAEGALQVRRTCYQYDSFGNRIGEIKPKAGLASCY